MNDNSEAYQDAPFQYSITDPTLNVVHVGASLGAKCGALLAVFYGWGVMGIGVVITDLPDNFHNFFDVLYRIGGVYAMAAQYGTVAALVGIFPGIFVGALCGWLIGKLFRRWIPEAVSTQRAIYIGFWVSLGLLAARLAFGALWIHWKYSNDPFLWMLWYGPNIVAFFGLWWVAYRLNTKMHEAYLPFSASAK